jgi:dienelactone hydrolase
VTREPAQAQRVRYLMGVTTVAELKALLGPFPEACDLRAETLERVDCGSFWREKVAYYAEANDRVYAFVCIPKCLTVPAPAIFCHHQHDDNFRLGKSEVVGLAGDPAQAYAAELAERGFITFSPDAITFEDRMFGAGVNGEEYFELTARLVQGRTLMAKVLHDVSVGLDYLQLRPEVDAGRVGFIGHSYGGRMALWVPAFDRRIKVSVSNCGCIPYRLSLTADTGIQMEFCIPGFMTHYDLENVIGAFGDCSLLISATTGDKWSRGARELYANLIAAGRRGVELRMYEGDHIFTKPMREACYQFLEKGLGGSTRGCE